MVVVFYDFDNVGELLGFSFLGGSLLRKYGEWVSVCDWDCECDKDCVRLWEREKDCDWDWDSMLLKVDSVEL